MMTMMSTMTTITTMTTAMMTTTTTIIGNCLVFLLAIDVIFSALILDFFCFQSRENELIKVLTK